MSKGTRKDGIAARGTPRSDGPMQGPPTIGTRPSPQKIGSQGVGHEAIRSPAQAALDAGAPVITGTGSGATSSANDAMTNPVYGGLQPVRSTIPPLAKRS